MVAGERSLSKSLTPEFAPPALSTKEIYDRQVSLAETGDPTVFKLSAQLLDQGRTDTPLCATEGMTARLKVYASLAFINSS